MRAQGPIDEAWRAYQALKKASPEARRKAREVYDHLVSIVEPESPAMLSTRQRVLRSKRGP